MDLIKDFSSLLEDYSVMHLLSWREVHTCSHLGISCNAVGWWNTWPVLQCDCEQRAMTRFLRAAQSSYVFKKSFWIISVLGSGFNKEPLRHVKMQTMTLWRSPATSRSSRSRKTYLTRACQETRARYYFVLLSLSRHVFLSLTSRQSFRCSPSAHAAACWLARWK